MNLILRNIMKKNNIQTNKFSKKWLIVIGIILAGIFVWAADAGNSFDTATLVEPNGTAETYTLDSSEMSSGLPPTSTDEDYFKIVLPTAGTLTLESTDADFWLYAYLYDSSKNEIASDTIEAFDPSSWPNMLSKDFSISVDLPAGTYYLKVGTYWNPMSLIGGLIGGSGGSTTYKFGSKFDTPVYSPKSSQFNVEKLNAKLGDYALNTQVTGNQFDLQVVHYADDLKTKESFYGDVQVELVDAGAASGSDCRSFKSVDVNQTVFLNNEESKQFTVTTDKAIRNAAMRLWGLKDKDGNIVSYHCTPEACYKSVYVRYYKKYGDTTCADSCKTSNKERECYECLVDNYGQAYCSRDNFSVRPYGVELTVKSKATEIQKNDTNANNIPNLISGLINDYTVQMRAKSANGNDTTGYDFRKLATDVRDVLNSKFDELREFFGLKFDNSEINDASKDITKCDDSSHKRFDAGVSGWKLENDNVGNYEVVLVDRNWTEVDQAGYKYRSPAVDNSKSDCIEKSTELYNSDKKLSGCDVQSFEVNSDAKFNKIPVKFVPDRIDIQSIAYGSYPAHTTRWAYMNNLDKTDSSYDMAAQFTGTVSAKNAKGDTVSNFTAGCMAQNVNLFTQYTTTQLDGKDVKAENTDGTILQGTDAMPSLHYAQSFNGGSFSSVTPVVTTSTTDTTDGSNYDDIIQTQASKDNFLDASLGSLVYDLRYNINKLYYVAVRPIEILFVKLSSALIGSDNLQVTAWKDGVSTNKIGEEKEYFTGGVTDIANNSFKFLYGRVYTDLEKYLPNGKSVKDDSVKTKFNALVYSNTAPSGILVNNGVLDTTAVDTSWYRVKGHSINEADGQIDELKVKSQEKGTPTITPSANVMFNSDKPNTTGITPDVAIAYPRPAARSNKVVVQIVPTIWLKYNMPKFAINFINTGYNWVGKGKTGNVVDQPVSGNAKNRLNW